MYSLFLVADQLSSKTDNHTFNQPVTNTVSQFQTNNYSKSQSAYQTSTPYYSNTVSFILV